MCQVPPYSSIKINPGTVQTIAGKDSSFVAKGDGELDGPILDAISEMRTTDGVQPLTGLHDARLAECLKSRDLAALQSAGPWHFFYSDGDSRYAECNFKGGMYQSLQFNWKDGQVALATSMNGSQRNGFSSQDLPGAFAIQSDKVVITPGVEELVLAAAN